MKTEQQRIAIGEACGWTRFPGRDKWETPPWGVPPNGDPRNDWKEVPDYLNDLNAIHAAIKTQPNDIQWAIFTELAKIVEAEIPAAFGSAEQYAQAFLKAKLLWKE